jgi:hypothetical protein
MKGKLFIFVCAWFVGSGLFAALIVHQDKNGHIVLSNTLDRGSSLRGNITFLSPARSHAIPSHYKEKIQTLTLKHQFREDMVIAVAHAESSFNPFAVSPKGAVGIMQLMRDTARQYGVINRYNVHENLEAGIRHLKYLYEKYQGNIPLTLAAYNAGEEAVNKYNGVPPYRETRQYIHRVMSLMGMSDTFLSPTRAGTKIYKYTNPAGQTMITDTPPTQALGTVEIIN